MAATRTNDRPPVEAHHRVHPSFLLVPNHAPTAGCHIDACAATAARQREASRCRTQTPLARDKPASAAHRRRCVHRSCQQSVRPFNAMASGRPRFERHAAPAADAVALGPSWRRGRQQQQWWWWSQQTRRPAAVLDDQMRNGLRSADVQGLRLLLWVFGGREATGRHRSVLSGARPVLRAGQLSDVPRVLCAVSVEVLSRSAAVW